MLCTGRNIILLLLFFVGGCSLANVGALPPLQRGTAAAPLEISGRLAQSLRLAGVVRVTGDLLIPAGLMLQIEPGSQVFVVGNDSTKIDPEYLDKGTEILVKGRLNILGLPGAPVSFSLDAETPAGENWAGFELLAAEAASFKYVDIIGAETGILSIDSSPRLQQVNILGSRNALFLQGLGELTYTGGRISGGDGGLLCFDQTTLNLSQLEIVDNLEEGLYLAAGCDVVHRRLLIERNDLGVVAPAAKRAQFLAVASNNRINFKPLAQGRTQ